MLQKLRVLHVISSRNGRYRPQASIRPEAAIGQQRLVVITLNLLKTLLGRGLRTVRIIIRMVTSEHRR